MPPTLSTHETSLPRRLRLRDLVLTQVLCVVGSSWVGIAAGLGRAQALTWIAAMVLFYLPMAVSVIYLNREMPLEGGLYVWAHTAFGDLGGFMTAWNVWFYGVAVTATILYAIPTELAYLIGPIAAWLPENHLASFAITAVVVLAITWAALRGLELGKWIHNIGGISILIVYCTLIVLPFWAIARHQPIHYEALPLQLPQFNMISLALFGQMLFGALCGLEYIALLAGESKDAARSIGQSVILSSPMICAMFIAGTSSVLAFARGHIDYIAPIPQTLRYALGNSGLANLFAMTAILLVQVRLIAAASFIFTGVTRLPLVAGWDHLIPAGSHDWTRDEALRQTPSPLPASLFCCSSSSPTSACTRRRPSRSSPTPPSPTTNSPTWPCSPSRSSEAQRSAHVSRAGFAGPRSWASALRSSASSSRLIPSSTSLTRAPTRSRSSAPPL